MKERVRARVFLKLLNTNLKMACAPVCSGCINNACDVAHCVAHFNRLHKRNDKRMEFPKDLTNFSGTNGTSAKGIDSFFV